MQKIHVLEAKAYKLEGQINVTQTVIYKTWLKHRSNTCGSHVLLLMAWQNLDTRKVLIIPIMWNKSLRFGGNAELGKMSSKTILIKQTLLDGQTNIVSNLELLSSQRTALRRWCLDNTRITEIHTSKDKNVMVSLYKLRWSFNPHTHLCRYAWCPESYA